MWENASTHYYQVLMDEHYNNYVEKQVWNTGSYDLLQEKNYICGYYIVEGEVHQYDTTYTKNTLIWITDGSNYPVVFSRSTTLIYIQTKRKLEGTKLQVRIYEDEKIPWSKPLEKGMTASRHMIKAEDYGVKIQTCIYTEDLVHSWHAHQFAHGLYVLEGMLKYEFEDGRNVIAGPGEFVVSDSMEKVLHVQAPSCNYCKYLFIGDGIFDFIVDGVNLYQKRG